VKKHDILFTLLILLAAWELLALAVHRPILPSPGQVLLAFAREILRGDLLVHFLASLWRVVASLALSIVLAVPAGLVLGQSARLSRLF